MLRAGHEANSPRKPDHKVARSDHTLTAVHAGSKRPCGRSVLRGSTGLARGSGQEVGIPVLACLTPEEVIKLAHAAKRDGVSLHIGERQACPLDDTHEAALGLLHLVWGTPEDEHGFRGPVDELLGPPQHTEYAGMGHYAEGGLVAHVG